MLGQKIGKEDWLSALCAVLALSGSSVRRNKTVQLKGWIRCFVSPEEVFSRGRHSKFYNLLEYSFGYSWREAHNGLMEVSWNIDKQLWRKQAQKISMSSSLCVSFRSWGLFLYWRCSQGSLWGFLPRPLKNQVVQLENTSDYINGSLFAESILVPL